MKTKLIDLKKRLVRYDKTNRVYTNGVDNNYPERVERIINNSATAKPAIKLFRKYIMGKGLDDSLNKFVVNKQENIFLRKFLFKICHSYAYHNGVFIHVNYNLNYKISSLKVLPYKHCLVGKKDDKDWGGKILVYDNWHGDNGPFDKKKINIIDSYNPNKNVIKAQMDKAGVIDNYKGQVFFYNPEDTIYPLAHIDNVLNDADSEFRIGKFKNNSLLQGFFGKTIMVTPPAIPKELNMPNDMLSEQERKEKSYLTTEKDEAQKNLENFLGAENSGGLLLLQTEFEGDDIDKAIKFISVKTDIDDKLFAHTEVSVSNNIAKSLGIPKILIDKTDKSIFGDSGALLQAAKEFFQEQREEDIQGLENELLHPLLSNFEGFEMPTGGVKIIRLIQKKEHDEVFDKQK